MVAGVGAPAFPFRVLCAGLFVHGIERRGAFDNAAVDTTETDITETAVLHACVPSCVVGHDEVVVVRSSISCNGTVFAHLLPVDSLREVNGKILVAAASSVAGAVVGAHGTLARATFVAGKAGALPSGAIANAAIRALNVPFVARSVVQGCSVGIDHRLGPADT